MSLRGSELGEISVIHQKKPVKNNRNEKFITNLNMSKLFEKLKARGRERKLKSLKSRKYRKSEKPKTKTRKYNKLNKKYVVVTYSYITSVCPLWHTAFFFPLISLISQNRR